jgi:hypothetical protein
MQDFVHCGCRDCAGFKAHHPACINGFECPMVPCEFCSKHATKSRCEVPELWFKKRRRERGLC